MEITVKTLKGDRFEIQVNPEDSVADVKKNIETVLGVTAAEQVLIHKGKVLKDETTVEANQLSEKSTIGVMKRNPASTGTSSASASLKRPRELSEQIEDPFTTDVLNLLKKEGICDLNIENKCNEKVPTQEEAALRRLLEPLRHTPEFAGLRALVQRDPTILEGSLEMLEEQNDPCAQFIRDNQTFFLRWLLEEPNNGGDSGNQVEESEETEVEQPQADQTNKPNNGGGDGGDQM